MSDDDYVEKDENLIDAESNNKPADYESDSEFEEQLNQFKERLENISKEATLKKRKLVPNINKGWIHHL